MNIKHTTGSRHWARAAQVLAPGALALAMAPAAPAGAKASKSKASKIAWQTNFEGAMAQAKKSGKPMFVDFYATWCGPCKALDAQVFPDPRVVSAARGYIAVKVDGDKRPDLMKKYSIEAYPSLGFFSPSGKLLKLQVGPPVPKKYTGDPYKAVSVELARMLKVYKAPRTMMAMTARR